MKPITLADKKKRLQTILSGCDGLVVAYSGGVDSTLLLALAREALGEKVVAVTAVSPIQPKREINEAITRARAIGVDHRLVNTHELSSADFVANSAQRCYFCKKTIFSGVFKLAHELQYPHVAHGVNTDDLADHRPGLQAAEEMGVLSPLRDAGFSKADIRQLSRQMGLPTWNKPAAACLASRVPYGTPITKERLQMVEASENVLIALGFSGIRVRHLGDTAKIEVRPADFLRLLKPEKRLKIIQEFKAIGFLYVTLDLEGYESGRMNRSIRA